MKPTEWEVFINRVTSIYRQYSSGAEVKILPEILKVIVDLGDADSATLLFLDVAQQVWACVRAPEVSGADLSLLWQASLSTWIGKLNANTPQVIKIPGQARSFAVLPISGDPGAGFCILLLEGARNTYFLQHNLVQVAAWLVPLIQNYQLRRSYNQLKGLNHAIGVIASASNLEEVSASGLQQGLAAIRMQSATVYLYDKDLQRLNVYAHLTPSEGDIANVPNFADHEFAQRAFNEKRILRRPSAPTAPALICLPMVSEGHGLGVLALRALPGAAIGVEIEDLLQMAVEQLALAIKRNELAKVLGEQLQAMRNLYELSAAFLSQSRTNDITFILLRTLHDLMPDVLAAAFYRQEDNQWQRTQVYGNHRKMQLKGKWQAGPIWKGEDILLNACRQERMLVLGSRRRSQIPLLWENIENLGGREILYFPLSLPKRDFLGIVAVIRTVPHPMNAHEAALIWATIQQATAALARVYLYEASRSSESRLRAILDSSQDGILLVESNRQIRYINQEAQRFLAIQRQGVTWEGQSLATVTAVFRREAPVFADWLMQNAGQLWEPQSTVEDVTPLVFQSKEGLSLKVQHWPVFSETAQFLGVLILLRDITEQQNLEKMRNDLLNMIVHDMRNPLTNILNALDVLSDPTMGDFRGEVIQIAKNSSDRLLRLVHEILDSNLEPGYKPHQEPLALEEHLRKKLREMGLLMQPVQVQCDFQPDFPLLFVDVDLVSRVFDNLLSNALKFTSQTGGVIRITAKQQDEWALIEVYNNGPHIPADLMPVLFQKFVTGEYEKRGYGLGLAFCRVALEAHGGKIWVENCSTGGVAFFMTLPIFRAPMFLEDEED